MRGMHVFSTLYQKDYPNFLSGVTSLGRAGVVQWTWPVTPRPTRPTMSTCVSASSRVDRLSSGPEKPPLNNEAQLQPSVLPKPTLIDRPVDM